MQLASRAGVAQSVISAYESGQRRPAFATIARFVNAAGFTLDVCARRLIRFVADLNPDRHKGTGMRYKSVFELGQGAVCVPRRHKRARSAGYAPVSGLGPRALCRSCWPDNEARQQPRGRVHTRPCRASSHHLVPARGRQQVGYAVLDDGSWKVGYDTFARVLGWAGATQPSPPPRPR